MQREGDLRQMIGKCSQRLCIYCEREFNGMRCHVRRGASTTVYDRFRLWESQGFFRQLWRSGLQEFDELVGIDWEWQSMDGVMTKAPLGGGATGPNPTDRINPWNQAESALRGAWITPLDCGGWGKCSRHQTGSPNSG